MILKKTFILVIFLVTFFKVNAQNFELGKVSIAEIEEKVHPNDSSAIAAILFKKGKTTFVYEQNEGFSILTEVKTRVKIYKKEGYDWANEKVRYYLGNGSKESINFSEAVTYNLVGGKIEKTKLRSDGEFDEVINRYWGQKKIIMPNVKEGSVIEFQYVIKSHNVGNPRDWNFQSNIPVNFSEYKMQVPEYFIYNTSLKGFVAPLVTVEKQSRSINLITKEKSEQRGFNAAKTTISNEKIDYIETKTTFLAQNLKAMKEESYINNMDNYRASLALELAMTKYPNETLKPYSTDWNAVVKTIYDYEDFGPELNKTGYFEDDLKAILVGLVSDEDKILTIFNYVKKTVKWNEYYGYSCNDGVKKAYKDKAGNVAEINLMLTAMLRYSGIKANPVLISTRSNGIALFPNRTAFDYVITAVEMEDSMILLDATEKYSMPNVLPIRDINWFGRLIRNDGTSIDVDLMPKKNSNDIVTINYAIAADGSVSGKLRRQRSDHNAIAFRKNIEDITEDVYLEKLENAHNAIEIKEYSRANEKELMLPAIETFSFSGSNLSENIAEKIYINPMLFYANVENPFKQENREYPVDFGYPFMDKYAINIQIPDGYQVETFPEASLFSMQDNIGSYKFLTNISGNTIQLSVILQINEAIVSSDNYKMLKEFYQKMIEKENEKIVLKKI